MQLTECVRDVELYNDSIVCGSLLNFNFASGKNYMICELIKKNGPLCANAYMRVCLRIFPLALPNGLIKIMKMNECGGCHFVSTLN